MSNFMIGYYGGEKPSSKEEGMAHMQKWQTWVESLGQAVVNAGTPLMNTTILTSNSVKEDDDKNKLNGFAVIKAETIEAAVEIAKQDPFLSMNGTIRVSQMMEMNK